MLYTVKLHGLAPWEMKCLERTLSYFQRNGIKITYLKKVIYIHCDSNKPYQGLLNIMHSYTRSNRISYNEKTAKWLSQYFPFRQ